MNSQRLQQLRSDLNNQFPERREVIDGALCALLVGESALLIGLPGTAKSALIRAVAQSFGASYFEWLLTRMTTVEEVFGPISLRSLEQDRYARILTGKLATAEVAFLDEIFKSSSSLLNASLSLLNERTYFNDGVPVKCPLISLFGASNELPEGKDLEALFDRFLLRFEVGYLLRADSLKTVLAAPDPAPATSLSMVDLRNAQSHVAKVTVSDDTIDALIEIRDACKAEGIVASDRRWKKSLKLAQASAFLLGDPTTTPADLGLLTHVLWREPKEAPKIARIVGKLADPVSAQAAEVLDAARESACKAAALKAGDRKAYVGACAEALSQFQQQERKLAQLKKSAGRRALQVIEDASREINALHAELARTVSAGLGLRSVRS